MRRQRSLTDKDAIKIFNSCVNTPMSRAMSYINDLRPDITNPKES